MPIRLNGSTSGFVDIAATPVAGNVVHTIPPGPAGTLHVPGNNTAIQATSVQNTTSGTNIDFTGIPSWVRRITLNIFNVSTSGTNVPLIQIGNGSFLTTGYISSGSLVFGTNVTGVINTTSGFGIFSNQAADVMFGTVVLTLHPGVGWLCSGVVGITGRTGNAIVNGGVNGAVIDRLRLTTVGGTDTFDLGSVSLLFE
jgi:hypothetical protein